MFCKFMAITGLGLLIQFVATGSGQSQSPCPNVFQYARDQVTGNFEGQILISDVPNEATVEIKVQMSLAASLPTKYYGTLELVDKDQAIENIKRGRPLLYRIRFPIQQPLPLITRILLNEQERCTGRRATGSVVTSIALHHTLVMGVISEPQIPSIGMNPVETPQFYPSRYTPSFTKPIPTTNPTTRPSETFPTVDWNALPITNSIFGTSAPRREFAEFSQCGEPRKKAANLLIARGQRTQPGDWPWVVALFVSDRKLEFQCAGSLISDKHVLTAANCMKSSDGQDLPASLILAVLGRHKLLSWGEKGSQSYEVAHFKLHTEYGKNGNFGNDLAVITLVNTVTFGELIRPICLWSGVQEVEKIVGKTGFVVGWGKNEKGEAILDAPRMSIVPIVSQEKCLRSHADFVTITSDRTFCGGARDGSGPCSGDSGAGLVIYDSERKKYQLRGLVSLSLPDRVTGACDLSQFVVYTDITKYLDWILQEITS